MSQNNNSNDSNNSNNSNNSNDSNDSNDSNNIALYNADGSDFLPESITAPFAALDKLTSTAEFTNPRAAGRKAALACLDSLLLDEINMQKLRLALQDRFEEDPATFFRQFVMPLLPREAQLRGEGANNTLINISMVEAPIDTLEPISAQGVVGTPTLLPLSSSLPLSVSRPTLKLHIQS